MLKRLLGSLALLAVILACALGVVVVGYYELQKPINLAQAKTSLSGKWIKVVA